VAENDALKEMQEQYRDQKARASELSRDLDLSRREIKSLQDKAAAVEPLEAEIEELKAELAGANQQIESMARAAQDADVNASVDSKRAAAFLAIREALLVK
jgi:hypothetical protein